MNTEITGVPIVISGPSGAGKDAICNLLFSKHEDLHRSVSYTTRPMRANEENRKNYIFIQKHNFINLIRSNQVFEYKIYADNYYGVPMKDMKRAKEEDVVFIVEVDGAKAIKAKRPDALLIFILPPDSKRLQVQQGGRGKERLEIAKREVQIANSIYDFIIVNDDISESCIEVLNIIHMWKRNSINMYKNRKLLKTFFD